MGLFYLTIMGLIGFGGLVFGYKFFKKEAIITIAIGSAVSANIFNIGSYAIKFGNYSLGIDSIIYTLFIFCVMLMLFNYNQKIAINLMITSLCSILYAGLISFIAGWATNGFGKNVVWGLLSYLISICASLIAILVTIYFFNKTKKHINKYLNLTLCIIISSIINSIIYFGLVAIFNGGIENFFSNLVGSYIGKLLATFFALISYFFINRFSHKQKKSVKVLPEDKAKTQTK